MQNYTKPQLMLKINLQSEINLQSINDSLEKMFRGYLISEYAETDSQMERAIILDDFLSFQKIIREIREIG